MAIWCAAALASVEYPGACHQLALSLCPHLEDLHAELILRPRMTQRRPDNPYTAIVILLYRRWCGYVALVLAHFI